MCNHVMARARAREIIGQSTYNCFSNSNKHQLCVMWISEISSQCKRCSVSLISLCHCFVFPPNFWWWIKEWRAQNYWCFAFWVSSEHTQLRQKHQTAMLPSPRPMYRVRYTVCLKQYFQNTINWMFSPTSTMTKASGFWATYRFW